MQTAVIRRSTDASFGKIPTTLVRRLISALTRSSGLFDFGFRPVLTRKRGKGAEILLGIIEHVRHGLEVWTQLIRDRIELFLH